MERVNKERFILMSFHTLSGAKLYDVNNECPQASSLLIQYNMETGRQTPWDKNDELMPSRCEFINN